MATRTDDDPIDLSDIVRRTRTDRTLRREADMMGFTVCIALLVALSVGRDGAAHSQVDVLVIVWGTTLGLALTHFFAMTLAAWLVKDPNFTYQPRELLVSQLAMATLVAASASVVVLVLSADFERLGARLTAVLFLGALVVLESRAGGSSLRRAVVVGALAITAGVAIAVFKWLISR